jgi:hypothetical protein
MVLDCNLMQRRIRPRSIGGHHQMELEPWHDGLGVGREEPCGCNYWRRVGGVSSLVIGGGTSLPRSWGCGASRFDSDSGLRARLDGRPKNRLAWLHHQPIC